MNQERFRQVRGIFEAALDQPETARAEYLADACAGDLTLAEEVRQLLLANEETEGLLATNQRSLKALAPHQQFIGPYEILRELGRGGMGVVYLSRRRDGELRRLFALKVLRPGLDDDSIVRRFRQERQILAALDHPNIARIHDEGRTDEGLPFYTMEFVDGLPINEYCDQNRLGIKARIALFQQVCAAVDYAHSHGVIHRDLKPRNIFVTKDGVAKLLDFGIATLLAPQVQMTMLVTDAGLRPMTPEYASPEQVRNEQITPASDVYSLGVVLYELLTGHKPYRLKKRLYHEVLRVICEEEPTRPSEAVNLPEEGDSISRLRQTTVSGLRSALTGDMDSILLKALCKDTHQRYASASQLSADLALYLDGAPVKARLGGMYRFGRELNRYRVWVAAGVFLLGAVVSGAINVNWSAIWIAAGVLAGFALWHAAADKEFGRRVAESSMWPVLTGLLTAATLIWCLLGANISAGINSARGGDGGVIVQFASASWFIGCAGIGLLFLRWTLRELWAGKLVTAASSKRSRALGIFALLLLLYVPFKLVLWGLLSGDFALPVMPVLSSALEALPWFLLYFLSGRLEFRQSGIVTPTGFYRWSKIESYAWDATGERLRLRIPRAVPFLPDITQRIPAPMREDVKRVLARFLSEWPSQTC